MGIGLRTLRGLRLLPPSGFEMQHSFRVSQGTHDCRNFCSGSRVVYVSENLRASDNKIEIMRNMTYE